MEESASFEPDAEFCPSFTLRKSQMQDEGFLEFVQRVFHDRPDIPAFKIIPPANWNPTDSDIDVDNLVIGTPIQQLVRPEQAAICFNC
jgi:hypothetical protein